ncbi:hypothetical protein BHM03_00031925 [Ensete ventricosum]|nr:hypothetical protein BHM03_00031925 [Ensete ventricosum]
METTTQHKCEKREPRTCLPAHPAYKYVRGREDVTGSDRKTVLDELHEHAHVDRAAPRGDVPGFRLLRTYGARSQEAVQAPVQRHPFRLREEDGRRGGRQRRAGGRRGRGVAEDDTDGGEVPAVGLLRGHILRRRRAAALGGAHAALAAKEPLAFLGAEGSDDRQLAIVCRRTPSVSPFSLFLFSSESSPPCLFFGLFK